MQQEDMVNSRSRIPPCEVVRDNSLNTRVSKARANEDRYMENSCFRSAAAVVVPKVVVFVTFIVVLIDFLDFLEEKEDEEDKGNR